MTRRHHKVPLHAISGAIATPAPVFTPSDANDAICDDRLAYRGSAELATVEQLLAMPDLTRPDPRGTGIVDLLGEVHSVHGRRTAPVFVNGPGLTLTFGAPGSGKSTLISTQLLRARRDSVIILDVKGEIYARCSEYLRTKMRVEQHGLFFEPSAEFNPLKAIPGTGDHAGTGPDWVWARTEIGNLAEDVVVATLDQPFWVNGGRAIFKALAGYVHGAPLARDSAERTSHPWKVRMRTMGEIHRLLVLPPAQRATLIEQGLMHSRPEVREGAGEWLALMQAREAHAAVVADLARQLAPWTHPVLAYSSQGCTYSFADLRREPTAVFLRVPPAQLEFCRAWLRAYFGTAMRHLTHDTQGCAVSIYLDEAALLGAMPSFDHLIGAIRGYRIRLNAYYQSLGQLKRAYPNSWETWLSTAMCKSYFGINDVDTAEWISRSMGDATIAVPSFQAGSAYATGQTTTSSRTTGTNTVRGGSWSRNAGLTKTEPELPFGTEPGQGQHPTTSQAEGTSEGGSWSDGFSEQNMQSSSGTTTSTSTDATQWTFTQRRLMDATEIMHMPEGMQIIQTPRGPVFARIARYFENPTLLARAKAVSQDSLPPPSYVLPPRAGRGAPGAPQH